MSHVFISYSHKEPDNTFAANLAQAIKDANYAVWKDTENLEAGASWPQELEKAVKSAFLFLVVMSPDSLQSEYVTNEVLTAQTNNCEISPIWYRGDDVFFTLKSRQAIDMRGQDGKELPKRLLDDLKKHFESYQAKEKAKAEAEKLALERLTITSDDSDKAIEKSSEKTNVAVKGKLSLKQKAAPQKAVEAKKQDAHTPETKAEKSEPNPRKSNFRVYAEVFLGIVAVLGLIISILTFLYGEGVLNNHPSPTPSQTISPEPSLATEETLNIWATIPASPNPNQTISPEPSHSDAVVLNESNFDLWAAANGYERNNDLDETIALAQANHLARLPMPVQSSKWCLDRFERDIATFGENLQLFVSVHPRDNALFLDDFLQSIPSSLDPIEYAYEEHLLATYQIVVIVVRSTQSANCYPFP